MTLTAKITLSDKRSSFVRNKIYTLITSPTHNTNCRYLGELHENDLIFEFPDGIEAHRLPGMYVMNGEGQPVRVMRAAQVVIQGYSGYSGYSDNSGYSGYFESLNSVPNTYVSLRVLQAQSAIKKMESKIQVFELIKQMFEPIKKHWKVAFISNMIFWSLTFAVTGSHVGLLFSIPVAMVASIWWDDLKKIFTTNIKKQ